MRREKKLIGIPVHQAIRSYGIGIDVAKDFHAICVLVPVAQEVRRHEFECKNTQEGLKRAKRRVLTLLPTEHTRDGLSYALESTATYHCPLIRSWGGRPCLVNPALATSFKARKTDRIDAFKLATQHLQGLWPESFLPTAEGEVLRALTRSRRRLIALRARITNSITTRLIQWNCFDKDRTARHPLVRACIEDLAAGRYKGNDPAFTDWKHVPDLIWKLMVSMYSSADAIGDSVSFVESQLKTALDRSDLERITSFPGVGPVTAATWVAEVEPCSRFPTAGHCIAFCGLDPTPQISGGKQVGTKLRLGNSHIRPAMIQAGHVLLNGRSLLASVIKERQAPRKLLVCIAARQLARLLYLSSLRGMSYDESKVQARRALPGPDAQPHFSDAGARVD